MRLSSKLNTWQSDLFKSSQWPSITERMNSNSLTRMQSSLKHKSALWLYSFFFFFASITQWSFSLKKKTIFACKVKLSLLPEIAIKMQPLIIQIFIQINHFEWFWSFETYWQYHEKIFLRKFLNIQMFNKMFW